MDGAAAGAPPAFGGAPNGLFGWAIAAELRKKIPKKIVAKREKSARFGVHAQHCKIALDR